MRLKRLLPLLLPLLLAGSARATHNRAGEIIVCHVGGSRYQATIITHTKLSAPADRPELVLNWGDGSPLDTIRRTNIQDDTTRDLRRSEYVAFHDYPNLGVYTLSFDDQNRNAGVINVPNSVSVSFCVKTQLVIGAATGPNCSARFLNSPIQDACLGQPWVHNPGAYDVDGDSLSFERAVCLGLECLPIAGYFFPGPNYTIDPVTGTITWNAPDTQGEYNIAFIVREWRKVSGVWVNTGWVMRDMQITVVPCDNRPPRIVQRADTCVVAGTFLSFNVQASDPDPGQNVTLTAQGQPFVVPSSPAVFVSPSPANSVAGVFSWGTECSHVRPQPYQVVFNAVDNGQPVRLHDYKTMRITVVAPPPLNPAATPSGNAIDLAWDRSVCPNATGYRIYRRSGLYGYVPAHCETDVPAYTGYTFIGSVVGLNNTTYRDEGGLVIGNQYCYMVVATFANGARSIASVEFCAILDRQVPVITHVSVGATDAVTGIDTVRWSNAYDLDSVARPGPYRFNLYRGAGFTTATELIWASPPHPYLAHPDTVFIDTGLNTSGQAYVYRVELLGNDGNDAIGPSDPASSVFISTEPNDQRITVRWALNTPWINSLYEVYRFDAGAWTLVGTSSTDSFTDTGLENGLEYCYLVRSTGAYSDPGIVAPLINFSQEVCGFPVDLTPPCVPELSIHNDCELPLNTLRWTNPANACGDTDTWAYNIWFASGPEGEYVLIATLIGAGDTVFTHVDGRSVSGCYKVTAIDSLGNESDFSAAVCGDNCPEYRLPNVFTPNGDGVNDRFLPFPYRGVEGIELRVFNRWGQVVFETLDPDINWNGTHKDSGEPLSDGVYFYVCQVFFKRLAGEDRMTLTGHVQILGSGAQPRMN